MKKTIKQLEEDLREARDSRDKYYSKWIALEDEDKKRKSELVYNLRSTHEQSIEYNQKLMEIIRWLINNETAKYPFIAEKTQRDDRKSNSIY